MPQFDSNRQPSERKPRGKAERTKILEAMERKSKTEDDFYDHLVDRAFDVKDSFGYKEVLQRMCPHKKSVMPDVEFYLEEKATPQVKASQILSAISTSQIPPDIGIGLINAIRNVLDIEANTDLKARIDKLEEMLDGR